MKKLLRPLFHCLLAAAFFFVIPPTAAQPAPAPTVQTTDCGKIYVGGAGGMRKSKLWMAAKLEPLDPSKREL